MELHFIDTLWAHVDGIDMTFDPGRPFNDLPDLPPTLQTETRAKRPPST